MKKLIFIITLALLLMPQKALAFTGFTPATPAYSTDYHYFYTQTLQPHCTTSTNNFVYYKPNGSFWWYGACTPEDPIHQAFDNFGTWTFLEITGSVNPYMSINLTTALTRSTTVSSWAYRFINGTQPAQLTVTPSTITQNDTITVNCSSVTDFVLAYYWGGSNYWAYGGGVPCSYTGGQGNLISGVGTFQLVEVTDQTVLPSYGYDDAITSPQYVSQTTLTVNPVNNGGGGGGISPTPIPMNDNVKTGFTDLLTSFIAGALSMIVIGLAIVGGYWLTKKLVNVLLNWFRKFNR